MKIMLFMELHLEIFALCRAIEHRSQGGHSSNQNLRKQTQRKPGVIK